MLVMAALAICAVTAAQLKTCTTAQAPPPASPDQAPPASTGLTPLTVHDLKRLLAAALRQQPSSRLETERPGHGHWDGATVRETGGT